MSAVLLLAGRPMAAARVVLLGAGFTLAVGLRVAVGAPDVARSTGGGLAFGVALLALAFIAGVRVQLSWRAVAYGIGGALLLSAPLVLRSALWTRPGLSAQHFWSWAAAVTVVVLAEELFLRGALFDAVSALAGSGPAVAVGAVGFALLHVPLYGWKVVPLDLVVGLILGELRRTTGTPVAPAITHLGADVTAWFLR